MMTPSLAIVFIFALAFVLPCTRSRRISRTCRCPRPTCSSLGSVSRLAARTSFLEGPAFDADGHPVLQRHDRQPDLHDDARRGPLRLPRRQRPDQRQHVRRPGPADQLRGGRARARRPPAGRPHRHRRPARSRCSPIATRASATTAPTTSCVDTKGRIWFTDPYYGEDRAMLEMGAEAVYRIDPDGKVARVISQPADRAAQRPGRSRPTRRRST